MRTLGLLSGRLCSNACYNVNYKVPACCLLWLLQWTQHCLCPPIPRQNLRHHGACLQLMLNQQVHCDSDPHLASMQALPLAATAGILVEIEHTADTVSGSADTQDRDCVRTHLGSLPLQDDTDRLLCSARPPAPECAQSSAGQRSNEEDRSEHEYGAHVDALFDGIRCDRVWGERSQRRGPRVRLYPQVGMS